MSLIFDNSPIVACSTSMQSNAAIGIIRISGFKALSDLQIIFDRELSSVAPRTTYVANLINGAHVLDNVVIIFFKGPNSFNGENILEIHAHGNILNLKNIMSLIVSKGLARMAFAGEFSYRAFQNKKLTLSQVEGLDLFLNATSGIMLGQGMKTLYGELHSQFMNLHQVFIKLKASIELSIDFLEDIGDQAATDNLNKNLSEFKNILFNLHTRSCGDYSSILSPEIVLFGETNAGKSSLFNALLNTDRSIVSNIAGTTRDYISEYIYIDGNNFKIIDTAGLRDSEDFIEQLGINKAIELLTKSFFKILVINPFIYKGDIYKRLKNFEFDLIVFTHADMANFKETKEALTNLPKFETSIDIGVAATGPIEPVVNLGSGSMGPALKLIQEMIAKKFKIISDTNPILIERHKEVIAKIYENTVKFSALVEQENDIAIVASELYQIEKSIEELIGIISPDQVLNSIFDNFCIGK